MNKTDVQKGKMVYYARMLKPVGIYEVCGFICKDS